MATLGNPMDQNIYSPAEDLSKGFNIGGKSDPPKPTIHSPMADMGSSDASPGSSFGDLDARTPISLNEVQFATGLPETDAAGLFGAEPLDGVRGST